MNRFGWFLSLTLILAVFMGIQADSSSESDSYDSSNESRKHGKKHKHHKHHSRPPHHDHYNHRVYMPQGPPPPYGGVYYPAPHMPYYYGYPLAAAPPSQMPYGANHYPYGGNYNQVPPQQYPPQQYPPQQYPPQHYPPQQYPPQQVPTQQYPPQQVPTQQYPPQQVPTQQYPPQQVPPQQATGQDTQTPQGYPGIPGGTSTINHSLKVNKEYQEDGHHYRPDGTPTN